MIIFVFIRVPPYKIIMLGNYLLNAGTVKKLQELDKKHPSFSRTGIYHISFPYKLQDTSLYLYQASTLRIELVDPKSSDSRVGTVGSGRYFEPSIIKVYRCSPAGSSSATSQ